MTTGERKVNEQLGHGGLCLGEGAGGGGSNGPEEGGGVSSGTFRWNDRGEGGRAFSSFRDKGCFTREMLFFVQVFLSLGGGTKDLKKRGGGFNSGEASSCRCRVGAAVEAERERHWCTEVEQDVVLVEEGAESELCVSRMAFGGTEPGTGTREGRRCSRKAATAVGIMWQV